MTEAAAAPEASEEPAEAAQPGPGPTEPGSEASEEPAEAAQPVEAAEPGSEVAPETPAASIGSPAARPEGRPIVERIGMASIAAVFAVLFGGVALAAFDGGELFLAVMAAIGCLMTVWVGAITLFRG